MPNQQYKSVYFSDHPGDSARERSVTLAFGNNQEDLFQAIGSLSSEELRQLIGHNSYSELVESAKDSYLSVNRYCLSKISGSIRETKHNDYQLPLPGTEIQDTLFDPLTTTFRSGKIEPFSRWYPFIEGYSPRFVSEIIRRFSPGAIRILDPFAGTGSTVVAASEMGIRSLYCELNPVLQFTSRVRLKARSLGEKEKYRLSNELVDLVRKIDLINKGDADHQLAATYKMAFHGSEFFDEDTYTQVLKIRLWLDSINERSPFLSDLATVGVLSSLVPASKMKRAGDLRYKTDKELSNGSPNLLTLLKANITEISEDLLKDFPIIQIEPQFICEDALNISRLPNLNIDTVITSPPYVNGTNYFRNTKIELWFLRALKKKSDIRKYRSMAITAGINDVRASDTPEKMRSWVGAIVSRLEDESYDSRIPKMIASYFDDMERAFLGISRHLVDGAIVAVDLGDSAYAGIHVPSHRLLDRTMDVLGYEKVDQVLLRPRRSRSGMTLGQYLLVYEFNAKHRPSRMGRKSEKWSKQWNIFKAELPHQHKPYSKRNWGHSRHSLCSYQGKLKPSIAHYLAKIFVPDGGKILDPFAGVGTIPFEAALQGKESYGFEISPAAYHIARGKCSNHDPEECKKIISDLSQRINGNVHDLSRTIMEYGEFGLNGRLKDYYEVETFNEIVISREYFRSKETISEGESFVLACLLHLLHGNRPYALSRRSHPITPYKPSGKFEYKSLIKSLGEKVERMLSEPVTDNFVNARIWLQDATMWWPDQVDELDAVITSPPFFDSTRFYAANWIRLWFSGWEPSDFDTKPLKFLDNRQKQSFQIYQPIFRQARERMKRNGVLVLHLGKSKKCDMAKELIDVAKPWFRKHDLLDESVVHLESHGIRDKGTVSSHQYLVLT